MDDAALHPIALALGFAVVLALALAILLVRLRVAARRRRARALAEDTTDATLRDTFAALPFAGESTAVILDENVDAFVARWRLLARARTSIDVTTFILSADAFGVSLLGLLLHKQREGVRVRLLVDWLGTFQGAQTKPWRELLQPLVDAGADVRVYNELRASHVSRLIRKLSLLPSAACDHDKIIVVDDEVAVTGGRNISQEYFADPHDDAHVFFDKDVVVTGAAAVAGLRQAFEEEFESKVAGHVQPSTDARCEGTFLELAARAMQRWLATPVLRDEAAALRLSKATRASIARDVVEAMKADATCELKGDLADHVARFASNLAALPGLRGALAREVPRAFHAETRVVDSCSHANCPENKLNEALLRLLAATRRSVVIQTPYVILTERALFALENAARRGVKITMLTNSPASSDNIFSQAVFLRQWPALLRRIRGLRLFAISVERNEHSKAVVFDDEIAIVGTYNLDVVSAGINGELAVVMRGADAARAVSASMRARIAAGAPIVCEYRVRHDGRRHGRPVIAFGPEHHVTPAKLLLTRLLSPFAALLSAFPRVAHP